MEDNNVIKDENQAEQKNVMDIIKERVASSNTIKELNDFLETLHPSDRYVVIRDLLGKTKTDMVIKARYTADQAEYQRYQIIKQESKASYDHDHTKATMIDIDKACTRVYTLLLQMIKVQNERIGELEDKLGINKVEDGAKNDNDKQENEQG